MELISPLDPGWDAALAAQTEALDTQDQSTRALIEYRVNRTK